MTKSHPWHRDDNTCTWLKFVDVMANVFEYDEWLWKTKTWRLDDVMVEWSRGKG